MVNFKADVPSVGFRSVINLNGKEYEFPLYKKEIVKESDLSDLGMRVRQKSSHSYFLFNHVLHPVLRDEMEPEINKQFRDCFRKKAITQAEDIKYELKIINAMRATYYSCYCFSQEQHGRSKVQIIFNTLSKVSMFRKVFRSAKNAEIGFISSYLESHDSDSLERFRTEYLKSEEKRLAAFSITDVFDDFDREYGEKYKAEYGYAFPYSHKRDDNTIERNIVNYWENETCHNALREDFWSFVGNYESLDEKCRSALLSLNVTEVQNIILDALDEFLENNITGTSSPRISSRNSFVSWEAKDVKTAEYLSLYADLMSGRPHRACQLCGAIFELDGRSKKKLYCDKHTRNEIDYYNRIKNRVISESKKNTGEQN